MKLSEKQGKKNRIGAYGEDVACKYLQNKGFSVLATNYLKPWGEVDVIAKKDKTVHFVEVKTVSHGTKTDLQANISRETWRPEENVHRHKLQKMARIAETWLLEQNWEGEWQIDVAAVRVVPSERYATVNFIENVILE